MKVTGILSVSSACALGYPFHLVAQNLSGLCDKVLVGVDPNFKEDRKFLESNDLPSNIKIVNSEWDRSNIKGGTEIAIQMEALVYEAEKEKADWVVVLQADEFLLETDFSMLRSFMERFPRVNGYKMERLYFWKDLNTIRADWNADMVRIFRPGSYSFLAQGATKDGMTTGKNHAGEEIKLDYKLYHYSRLGDPKEISKRIRNLDSFFHPPDKLEPVGNIGEYDFTVREYDNYTLDPSERPRLTEGSFINYNGPHPFGARHLYD